MEADILPEDGKVLLTTLATYNTILWHIVVFIRFLPLTGMCNTRAPQKVS